MSSTTEFHAVIAYDDFSKLRTHSWRLIGINLSSKSANTDRGRLYAKITKSGSTYTIRVFKAEGFADSGDHIASGTTTSIPAKVTLTANTSVTSTVSGSMWLAEYSADNAKLELIVAFADEGDLQRRFFAFTAMRGYDATWGFNEQLAEAHEKVLHEIAKRYETMLGAPGLPRVDRSTYFIDDTSSRRYPDLRRLANPEQDLRDIVCYYCLWHGCMATSERPDMLYEQRAEQFRREFYEGLNGLSLTFDQNTTGENDRVVGGVYFPVVGA